MSETGLLTPHRDSMGDNVMTGHHENYKRQHEVTSVLVNIKCMSTGNNKISPTNISRRFTSVHRSVHRCFPMHKFNRFIIHGQKIRWGEQKEIGFSRVLDFSWYIWYWVHTHTSVLCAQVSGQRCCQISCQSVKRCTKNLEQRHANIEHKQLIRRYLRSGFAGLTCQVG